MSRRSLLCHSIIHVTLHPQTMGIPFHTAVLLYSIFRENNTPWYTLVVVYICSLIVWCSLPLSLPPCVRVCVSRSMSHVDVVILLFRWSACFCLFFFFSLSQSFMVLICVHHVATPGKYVSIQRIRCGVALCVCVVHSLCLTWSEKKTKPAV